MPRKPLAALFLIALVAAACSSGNGDSVADGLEGATPTRQSTTVEADPTASSAPTTEPTTPPAGPPAEDALRTWVAMWDGAEQLVTDPTAADEAIGANADPSVAEQLATIFSPDVEGDVDIAARTFENHPVLTDTGDGTVRIDDCLQVTPPDTSPFVWFSGTATAVDGVWRVTSIEPEALGGCVPAEIADAAIAGYEAYWDARVVFWEPADPDHPLVEETLTGPQLEVIRDLLIDHEQRGLVLRGRAETHPEVVQITSATELTILDCMIQDPDRGVFDAATGERTDDIAPVAEGQRDLRSTVMVLEDGRWKVSECQGQANVRCDTVPTVQGLPSV